MTSDRIDINPEVMLGKQAARASVAMRGAMRAAMRGARPAAMRSARHPAVAAAAAAALASLALPLAAAETFDIGLAGNGA